MEYHKGFDHCSPELVAWKLMDNIRPNSATKKTRGPLLSIEEWLFNDGILMSWFMK